MKPRLLLLAILLTQTFYGQRINEPQSWKDYNLLEKVKSTFEKNNMGETVFTEFNAHGNVTKKTEKYGTSKNEAYYSYNSDSKPEKIVFINRDKKKEVLHTEVVFRYKNDSVFVKTDINEKGKKGEKSFVMIYEKEWMKKYYGKRKDDLEEYLLDYDAHGNKLSETKYVNGELIATKKYRYTYDENGKLKSKVFDDNTTTTFYPNGLIKTMEEYSYKYDGYDTFGNWTTMTINENKKIISKTKRTMVYYE